jgi:PAS domain-containing protein
LLYPDDRDKTIGWFNKGVAEKKEQLKLRNRQINAKTGESSTVLWSSSFHYDETSSISGVGGIGRDITDYKRAQEALHQSETYLQTLIHSISDLVWLKGEQGIYLFCNSKFERFFGAEEKKLLEKLIMILLIRTWLIFSGSMINWQ